MAKYCNATKKIISSVISNLKHHYPTCSVQNAAVTVILHLFLWSEWYFGRWVVQLEMKYSSSLPQDCSLGGGNTIWMKENSHLGIHSFHKVQLSWIVFYLVFLQIRMFQGNQWNSEYPVLEKYIVMFGSSVPLNQLTVPHGHQLLNAGSLNPSQGLKYFYFLTYF